MFSTEVGTPTSEPNFSRRTAKRVFERAGVTDASFHTLRHTNATRLLEENVHPAVVAAQLGHARTSTTTDIYSHVSPGIADQATAVMERLLGSLPKPKLVKRPQKARNSGGQEGGQSPRDEISLIN